MACMVQSRSRYRSVVLPQSFMDVKVPWHFPQQEQVLVKPLRIKSNAHRVGMGCWPFQWCFWDLVVFSFRMQTPAILDAPHSQCDNSFADGFSRVVMGTFYFCSCGHHQLRVAASLSLRLKWQNVNRKKICCDSFAQKHCFLCVCFLTYAYFMISSHIKIWCEQ